jgi:hypothetical protein
MIAQMSLAGLAPVDACRIQVDVVGEAHVERLLRRERRAAQSDVCGSWIKVLRIGEFRGGKRGRKGFVEVSSSSRVTCSSVSHHSAVSRVVVFDSVTNRRQGRRTGGGSGNGETEGLWRCCESKRCY